ncbi:MAG: hypothetical protein ACYC9J_07110 [Sulfuricaulis sp.]
MAVPVSYSDSAQRFRISITAEDIQLSIAEYFKRLGSEPVLVVKHEHALWRTSWLNLPIRKAGADPDIRHIGWEDTAAGGFIRDINAFVWEHFNATQQAEKIRQIRPGTLCRPS